MGGIIKFVANAVVTVCASQLRRQLNKKVIPWIIKNMNKR